MTPNTKMIEAKIYEKWLPKIKERYTEKGFTVADAKLKKIAKLAHVRKLYEDVQRASVGNVVGRGNFNLGNNPGDPSDSTKGSGEVYQNLFGVFLDAAATTYGMDLFPMLTMSKSNLTVFITEPVYANGKIDSASDLPEMFMVKATKVGSPTALAVGTEYTIKQTNASGTPVIKLTFVGVDRLKGYYMFRIKANARQSGFETTTIADCVDSTISAQAIWQTTNTVGYTFDADTVDYVNSFNNFVSGYVGAGANDTSNWFANRNNGKDAMSEPMTRQTGEKTYYRSLGLHNWSKNFSARTYHVDIEYTTEQIQDMKMDHDTDAIEIGDMAMQDQLAQAMNDHALGVIYANGWQNHYDMFTANGFNLNAAFSTTTGSAKTFLGADFSTSLTISGPTASIPSSGAIYENLSSIQRRVVSRMAYASAVVNTRCRKGRGDTSSLNATFGTALEDVRGYQAAPFESSGEGNGLYLKGTFNKMQVYEDGLADLTDERIAVFRKGKDNDPGMKLCVYLLAEKISTIAEGTMSTKEALKSRYVIAGAGSNPQLNYLTFTIEQAAGFKVI